MLEKLWQYISVDFIMIWQYVRFSKMSYFITITEKIMVEGLARLFGNNMQKLLESVISDRELQFTAGLIKKLSNMLGIETKLSTTFYSQIDESEAGVVFKDIH